MTALRVGSITLSEIRGDAMTFARTPRHVSLRERDELTVGLLLDGSAIVEQDARVTRLEPGDLVLCDNRRPFCIRFERTFRKVVIQSECAALASRLPDAEHRTARGVRGQSALLLATTHYLTEAASQTSDGSADDALARHAIEVLAIALGGTPRAPATHPLLARIHAYIEDNLANPALSPSVIARQHRISRRLLYRLFEEAGDSVAAFIRRRRLVRCRAMLTDRRHGRLSISEIAFALGFNDASTFGRAFREAFGATPRDYRRAFIDSTGEIRLPPSGSN